MKILVQTLKTLLILGAIIPFAAASESRLPRSQYKNGPDVRAAFREVIKSPRHSTVRIFCDGKDAALGVVVDASGGVITKASQLNGKIVCRLADGRELDATITGIHEKFDLALLRIDAKNLPVIEWDRTNGPEVGQWLITPGPEDIPVAVGVVSVKLRTLPEERAALGVAIESVKEGQRITRIIPSGPAQESGLKAGDIIRRIAGVATSTEDSLVDTIGRHKPGDKVSIEYQRGDEVATIEITLDHPPPEMRSRAGFMNHLGGNLSRRRSGFPPIMQHDTVLKPEECGGPLLGLSGKAVGINVARGGRTESYALPVATILPAIEELKSGRLAPKPAEPEPVESKPSVPVASPK